jgi:type VI secretion system Hcp family effector
MAFDAYLYVTNIRGETSSKHPALKNGPGSKVGGTAPFEITDFDPVNIEMPVNENRSAAGAATAGRAVLNVFSCSKALDTATLPLMKACMTGATIPKIVCEVYRSGGANVGALTLSMVIEFTNCVISESTFDASGDEAPKEKLTFSYESLLYQYQRLDASGAAKGSPKNFTWDQKANVGTRKAGIL